METGAKVPYRPAKIASRRPSPPRPFLQNPLASTIAGRRLAASAGEKRTALILSTVLTLAMFGVLMLVSVSAGTFAPAAQVLVAFDLQAPPPEPQGKPAPAAAKPAAASIPAAGEPASAPAPRPAAAPPAPLRLPVMAIDLAQPLAPQMTIDLPLVPIEPAGGLSQALGGTGEGTGSGNAEGDGGEGTGGSGRGGRKLIASWAPSMDFGKDSRHYPAAARSAKVEGKAWMRCMVVRRDRVRDCTLLDEEPRGFGFGQAALKTVPGLRIRLHDERGERVYDDWTIVVSTFYLDDLPEYRQAREEAAAAAPEPAP
jgi:protein TonB